VQALNFKIIKELIMTTKILSYEELVEKRKDLKEKMRLALDHNCDLQFTLAYEQYQKVVEKIKDIDDYWNAHD
jgi:hypothetical protein